MRIPAGDSRDKRWIAAATADEDGDWIERINKLIEQAPKLAGFKAFANLLEKHVLSAQVATPG